MGSILHMSQAINEGLKLACPWQRKTQRDKLSIAIAGFMDSLTANTMATASILPLNSSRTDMKYQWLSRLLANRLIEVDKIMSPFAQQIMKSNPGNVVELIIDQTSINERHSILMVSVKCGQKALPVLWKVKKGLHGMRYEEQEALLSRVKQMISKDKKVMLLGDRFYGTPALIKLCKDWDWDYRLRLKKTYVLYEEDKTNRTKISRKRGKEHFIKNVQLSSAKVKTHIDIVRDKGYEDAWVIAMGKIPNRERVMEYKKRWSIETLFSDFKSRGLGLEDTKLIYPDRVERLLLILSLAIYWSVKAGREDENKSPLPYERKVIKSKYRRKRPLYREKKKLGQSCRGLEGV